MRRRWLALALVCGLASASCGEKGDSLRTVSLADASPGDSVGLIAVETDDGRFVEWLDRIDGTINRLDIDDTAAGVTTVARIEVGTNGDQHGLLGQVILDGRRFASWTAAGTSDLVVGEVLDDSSARVVWSAGEVGNGAIGGVLAGHDGGGLLIGLGRNTAWDAETGVGGAILELDPDGAPDQTEVVVSIGYTNPWAFAVTADGGVWVADNAAGPDPDDESRDDVERIGRADLVAARNEMTEVNWPGRAPTAMVELPDGRIGICGFLDNELRAYEIVESDPEPPTLDRAGTIMPCLTGAAVFEDGSVATIAQTDDGMAIHILNP